MKVLGYLLLRDHSEVDSMHSQFERTCRQIGVELHSTDRCHDNGMVRCPSDQTADS